MQMELNPYASFQAGKDPVEILRSTRAHLVTLTERLPAEQLALRTPVGKWNAREIVAHLADCELVFSFRLRQTLGKTIRRCSRSIRIAGRRATPTAI